MLKRIMLPILVLLVLFVAAAAPAAAQGNDLPILQDRPLLGVAYQNVDGEAVVTQVLPQSAAAEAGLKKGDIITAVNDQTVDASSVASVIGSYAPGDTVTITIERDGESMTLDVELGSQTERGTTITRIGGDEVNYLEDQSAWEIVEITEGGVLDEAGLQSGDIVTAINGEPISPETLPDQVTPDSTITLTVQRGDETLELEASGLAQFALLAASHHQAILPFDFRGAPVPFWFGNPQENQPGEPPFGFNTPPDGRLPFNMRAAGPIKLGVAFVTLDEDTATEHDIDVTEGALVTMVIPDTPADDAGLAKGDIITAVDGDIVDFERTLADRIAAYEPDDTITLDVLRDGETLQIQVTLTNVEMGNYQFQSNFERPPTPPDA